MSPANKVPPYRGEPLPDELREALLPAVSTIVDAAVSAIRSHGPPLGRSEQGLERNLRVGLTDAVDRWFGSTPVSGGGELHFALGRAQARAGRSLDELMRIYTIAGQTAWRRLTEVGTAQGIPPEDLYLLAETGFGYVEELSTQAAAGFAEEQSHRSGASHTRRSELVRLLLSEPQPEPGVLLAQARAVGIELSATLAAFAGPAEGYDAFVRHSHEHFVLGPRDGTFAGVLFDPDSGARRRQLVAAAERASVQIALGHVVPVARAARSLARAQALLSLLDRELVRGGAVVDAGDHDVALLLAAAPELAEQVASRCLAPLDTVRGAASRSALEETLRAWLQHQGQRKTIAHALNVHPQTVGYRMARLRELFGRALDDPDARFELELAVRLRRYTTLDGDEDARSSAPSA